MGGLVAVAVTLAVASAAGLWLQRSGHRLGRRQGTRAAPARETVAADELGAPLGERATLVQFSTAFCQPCRATRRVLGDVAGQLPASRTSRSTPRATSTWYAGSTSGVPPPSSCSTPGAASCVGPADSRARPTSSQRSARPSRESAPSQGVERGSCRSVDTSTIGPVSTELTQRRAVDLLRVATALCRLPDTRRHPFRLCQERTRVTDRAARRHAAVRRCPSSTPAVRGSAAALTTVVLAARRCSPAVGLAARRCRPSSSRSAPPGPARRTALLFAPAASARGSARRPSSRTPARRGSPRRVGLGFAVVGLARLRDRRRPSLGLRRDRLRPGRRLPQRGLRLLPRLRGLPADATQQPHHPHGPAGPFRHTTHGGPRMSRRHANASSSTPTGSRPTSTTRRSSSSRSTRTPPPTTRATSGAPSSSTGRPTCRTRSAATSSTRRSSRRCCPRKGIAQRRHRRALRRQQQLVRGLRLLVLQALRPRRRQAARRRPQEVGARLPRAGRRASPSAPATTYTAKEQDRSIRAFRDEVVGRDRREEPRRRAQPRRVRRPAARPGAPAAGAVAARRATSRPRANIPWSKAANDDGTFKSDDELKALYAGGASTWARTPSPTAASASARRTPGSCCTSSSASRTSRTTTAPGPSTARSSASRSRSATSRQPRDGLMCGATAGRPVARRRRRRQGGRHPGPGRDPRRRAGRQRLRAAARPHR